MKLLASILALTFAASTAMAYGSFVASATPTLTFPKDMSTTKTVTKDTVPVSK